jgi:hypothetical protein
MNGFMAAILEIYKIYKMIGMLCVLRTRLVFLWLACNAYLNWLSGTGGLHTYSLAYALTFCLRTCFLPAYLIIAFTIAF